MNRESQPSLAVQKTATGIPIRNLWYMLLYVWKETLHSPYWQLVNPDSMPTLDALLATVLLRLLRQRLRIGLGCSYMAEQHLLRGIRGRIHFTHSIKQRAFNRGQAFCEFENFTINALKNQIIRSTLFTLVRIGDFGPDAKSACELRHKLRQMVRLLEGIDVIELTPDIIHRELMKRHDHDYRVMLSLCDLILQRQLPTEMDGTVYSSFLERERLMLHRIYERFVANFYRFNLPHWKVQPQKSLQWYETPHTPSMPTMRPDLVLENRQSGRMIILDTKFTAKSLKENQWGKELFDSSHLYQMYAYLRTQDHRSSAHRQANGILLYPTIEYEISETISLPIHQIRIETIDLAAEWQEIDHHLRDIIEPGNLLKANDVH